MTRYLVNIVRLFLFLGVCLPLSVYAGDGLGRTKEYADAIKGDRPLSEEDKKIMTKVANMSLPKNKYFFELGTAFGDSTIKGMRNNSVGATTSVVQTEATKSNRKLMVGLGYRWEQLSLGADLLLHGKVNYYSNPMLTGGSTQIDSDISTIAILWHGRFDIVQTRWVSPYVGLGVGLARHDTESRLKTTAGALQSTSTKINKVLAYRYNAGLKCWVAPLKGYLDIGYQIVDLGEVSLVPAADTKLKSKEYKTTGFYLGYIHEF